jgi:FkbM family methyltransferase
MKLHDKLEDTLGGKWSGLHGEVVTQDCYRVRELKWHPDLVFDLGANVGTFTRHALDLWPRCQVVAVEPDPENAAHFRKFTDMSRVELIEAAIGKGQIWKASGAANGSGEVYMSCGVGYPKLKMPKASNMSRSEVKAINLQGLCKGRLNRNLKTVLKLDIEGAEHAIFSDPRSMKYLWQMDYLAMELHRYAIDGSEQEAANELVELAVTLLKDSHFVQVAGVHLWAWKKNISL